MVKIWCLIYEWAFFREHRKPQGTRNEHWLANCLFLKLRSQKDLNFTIASKKSLCLAWIRGFFSAAFTCLNEAWFLRLDDRRKRRAETSSRPHSFVSRIFKSPGNEVDISPVLLQVGAPHVLLTVLVSCELCLFLFAQNWKIKYEPVSAHHSLAYFLLVLRENWDNNVIVSLSRYGNHWYRINYLNRWGGFGIHPCRLERISQVRKYILLQ